MNAENRIQGDVALFIDWENIKSSLQNRGRERPNLSALRDTAESFGRLVVARAYADWQEGWHADDPPALYAAGIDPVYVPTRKFASTESAEGMRRKNSVDIKLVADCIEVSHQFPDINTFVLVSGDGDFVHLVNILRPYGKHVVAIGVSWSTNARLSQVVDQFLYYDRDVAPEQPVAAAAVPAAQNAELERSFRAAIETLRDSRQPGRGLLSWVKHEMIKRLRGFDQSKFGFTQFKQFMEEAERRGLLTIETHGLEDWAVLPDAPSASPVERDTMQERITVSAAGQEALARLIRFADDFEHKHDHIAFNFLVDGMMESKILPNYTRPQLVDLVNDAIRQKVFMRQARQWQMRNTGETVTVQALVLNCDHSDVVSVLSANHTGNSQPTISDGGLRISA
jgi:uncharacterized LabA/DUF88 family protein